MRISKPFVGFSYIDVPVADFYTGDQIGSGKANGAKQTLHLRGRVVVPQNCIINDNVDSIVDFGNIPTYAFKQAGIGNKIPGLPKGNMPSVSYTHLDVYKRQSIHSMMCFMVK